MNIKATIIMRSLTVTLVFISLLNSIDGFILGSSRPNPGLSRFHIISKLDNERTLSTLHATTGTPEEAVPTTGKPH